MHYRKPILIHPSISSNLIQAVYGAYLLGLILLHCPTALLALLNLPLGGFKGTTQPHGPSLNVDLIDAPVHHNERYYYSCRCFVNLGTPAVVSQQYFLL